MTSQIFVSYARADTIIEPFLADLEAHLPDHYHVWIDKQIKPSEEWQQAIDNAIEVSFAVLVILTPKSSESKYVTYEWSYSLGKARRVITLLLEKPDDIHPRLQSFNWLDFSQRYREPWDALLAALEEAHQEFLSTTGPILALELLRDGHAKHERNDLHNALDTLSQALDFAPDHLKDDIHYEIATIYREMKSEDDTQHRQNLAYAKAQLDQALHHNPRHVRAMVMLGEFYRVEGDQAPDEEVRETAYVNAEARFRSALRIQPDILDESGESVWASLGGILKRRNDIPKAIEYYKRAARARRTSYPYNNLGLLYMQQGDVQQMRSSFNIVRLLSENRIKYHDAIDDWAYNDYLVSLIVSDDIETAAIILDTIMMVSQAWALNSLISTLEGMIALPGASQPTLDFIGMAIERLREHVQHMASMD